MPRSSVGFAALMGGMEGLGDRRQRPSRPQVSSSYPNRHRTPSPSMSMKAKMPRSSSSLRRPRTAPAWRLPASSGDVANTAVSPLTSFLRGEQPVRTQTGEDGQGFEAVAASPLRILTSRSLSATTDALDRRTGLSFCPHAVSKVSAIMPVSRYFIFVSLTGARRATNRCCIDAFE